jgi:hypothetical protein
MPWIVWILEHKLVAALAAGGVLVLAVAVLLLPRWGSS